MSHILSLSDSKVGLACKDSFLAAGIQFVDLQDSNLCRPLICALHSLNFHYYFAFSCKYLVDRPRSDEELRVLILVLPLMFDLPTAVREYRKLRNKHAVWRSAIARQSLALWLCATGQSNSLAPVIASRKTKKPLPRQLHLRPIAILARRRGLLGL